MLLVAIANTSDDDDLVVVLLNPSAYATRDVSACVCTDGVRLKLWGLLRVFTDGTPISVKLVEIENAREKGIG